MTIKRPLFALFGWASLTFACEPGAPSTADSLTMFVESASAGELDADIFSLMDSAGVTGLSIAVVTDSGIAWTRGLGVRDTGLGAPVAESTVFEAASLSKPVFAYAVLQLVDQGLIHLDTPIAELYEYESIAHDDRHRGITPRMVLTHSTGFPNWRPRGGQLTIGFEPGSEFSYSGEGFVYLQRAVMDLTGEPLDQLVHRLVFEPLGMGNSSYLWQDSFEENVALPHGSDGETLRKFKPQEGRGNAAASLHTTAPDFAVFLMAVMNGTMLSDSTATAMLQPQIEVDSGLAWGLGIGLQDNEQGRAFWHWGDNTGYKAFTIGYPEHGVGVVWFTNSENGHLILEDMLDLTVSGTHPAVRWLDYEQHDSPRRAVRLALEQAWREQGLEAGISLYRELKATRPAAAFDEFLLNSLGYRLMRSDQLQDAIAVFELNVAEYPDASNPYDSLGEAYLAAGDTVRAIENYQKSVQLDPGNTNGKAVLESLGVH